MPSSKLVQNGSSSLTHRVLSTAMRPIGFSKQSTEKAKAYIVNRDAKASAPVVPPAKTVAGLDVSQSDERGFPIWTLRRTGSTTAPRKVIMAIHGGAYVTEINAMTWALYAGWARADDVDVIVPIYPLAPHGTAGRIVPIVADLIADLIRERGPDRVAVEGDSAGAGLALAAVQEVLRRGIESPARLVLISPFLDVTLSDPRSRTINDPFLSIDALREWGRQWAGDLDPAHPMVSPINGSMEGIRGLAAYSGTIDCLCPDTWRLKDATDALGIDAYYDIRTGLSHGWAGFSFIPDARSVAPIVRRQLLGR